MKNLGHVQIYILRFFVRPPNRFFSVWMREQSRKEKKLSQKTFLDENYKKNLDSTQQYAA